MREGERETKREREKDIYIYVYTCLLSIAEDVKSLFQDFEQQAFQKIKPYVEHDMPLMTQLENKNESIQTGPRQHLLEDRDRGSGQGNITVKLAFRETVPACPGSAQNNHI